MPAFERYLSVWVALAILAGLGLGQIAPGLVNFLASLEYGSVNFVVAVLIWFMVYPMMVAVDFSSLARIHERPKGLIITLAVNWLIKPFTMAALGVLFFELIFAPFIEPGTAGQYIAGLILLGAAPCTAMVFVWSTLTKGDPNYTLAQVSLNDAIMIFAYAPIVALLLGVTDISVPWATLVLSVGLYVVIPLIAGIITRIVMTRRAANPGEAEAAVDAFTGRVKPLSVLGLLATVVLLFGFQGEVILNQPLVIVMIAIPLLIQSYGIFAVPHRGRTADAGHASPGSDAEQEPAATPVDWRVGRSDLGTGGCGWRDLDRSGAATPGRGCQIRRPHRQCRDPVLVSRRVPDLFTIRVDGLGATGGGRRRGSGRRLSWWQADESALECGPYQTADRCVAHRDGCEVVGNTAVFPIFLTLIQGCPGLAVKHEGSSSSEPKRKDVWNSPREDALMTRPAERVIRGSEKR